MAAAAIITSGPDRSATGGMLTNRGQCNGLASGMAIYPTSKSAGTYDSTKGMVGNDRGTAAEVGVVTAGDKSPNCKASSAIKPRSDFLGSNSNSSDRMGTEASRRISSDTLGSIGTSIGRPTTNPPSPEVSSGMVLAVNNRNVVVTV